MIKPKESGIQHNEKPSEYGNIISGIPNKNKTPCEVSGPLQLTKMTN
jgi:hypothetical protein